MNTSSVVWISGTYLLLQCFLLTGTLIIVWIGWRRQRKIGFLILVGWAITALFSIAGQALWSLLMRHFFRDLLPSPSTALLVLPHFAASFVCSALLLAGLALLVFRDSGRRDSPK